MNIVGRCKLSLDCRCFRCSERDPSKSPVVVIDFNPIKRTLFHRPFDASGTNSDRPECRTFLRFPYLRFLVGYSDDYPHLQAPSSGPVRRMKNRKMVGTKGQRKKFKRKVLKEKNGTKADHEYRQKRRTRYRWNRRLHLYGSMTPFEKDALGFALPLPNCNYLGLLTCAGTMPNHCASSPEGLVAPVVGDFWNSVFYNTLDHSFPLNDGTSIRSLSEFKYRNNEVFGLLPPMTCGRLEDWVEETPGRILVPASHTATPYSLF